MFAGGSTRLVVALTGPRSEQQQDTSATPCCKGVTFGRFEPEERASTDHSRLTSGCHLHGAVDDENPRVLVHFMVAEFLTGLQHDEDSSRTFVLVDDYRVTHTLWRTNLKQVPLLHTAEPYWIVPSAWSYRGPPSPGRSISRR